MRARCSPADFRTGSDRARRDGKKSAQRSKPYAVGPADGEIMGLAGLWETWRSPEGETVRSFTIVTTTPNALCVRIHDRMPVILKPETWPEWLGEEPTDLPVLKGLLGPYPAEESRC